MNILFVTWDGPQVSYLEGLFLPIFERLSQVGMHFHVLQFTWGGTATVEVRRHACEKAGVSYRSITVWRKPRALGAMLTALAGARHVRKAVQEHDVDLVMARSTLPALATMLALRDSQCRMVFDADGLPLDERVDFAGQSPSGLAHRLLRDLEAQAVRRADVVLTRTSRAVEILHARAGSGAALSRFHVVTNGRDSECFKLSDAEERAKVRRDLGLTMDDPLMVYAGSMGLNTALTKCFSFFPRCVSVRPMLTF